MKVKNDYLPFPSEAFVSCETRMNTIEIWKKTTLKIYSYSLKHSKSHEFQT